MTGVESEAPSLRSVAVAAAQLTLIAGLVWWSSTDTHDATSTTVDWGSVANTVAWPTCLAISALAGWALTRRSTIKRSATQRLVRLIQWLTLALLILSLIVAPTIVIGEIAFEPLG